MDLSGIGGKLTEQVSKHVPQEYKPVLDQIFQEHAGEEEGTILEVIKARIPQLAPEIAKLAAARISKGDKPL